AFVEGLELGLQIAAPSEPEHWGPGPGGAGNPLQDLVSCNLDLDDGEIGLPRVKDGHGPWTVAYLAGDADPVVQGKADQSSDRRLFHAHQDLYRIRLGNLLPYHVPPPSCRDNAERTAQISLSARI